MRVVTPGVCRMITAFGLIVAGYSLLPQRGFSQGCIVARSNGEQGGPESEGGYLTPGEWQFGIDYRHQYSYIHFVGPTEQSYRITDGTQVENKINLENFTAIYQMTPRFSVEADVPLLLASRHSNNSPIVYTADGIADSSILFQGWIWNPQENSRGNLQLGLGVLFPTGKDNVANTVDALNGKGPYTAIVDYSIQPGQGAFGIPWSWVAFKNWGVNQLYFNGSYLMMLKDRNNVWRTNAIANPLTLTQYNAVMDQYLMEGGVAHPVSKIRGLTLTFGPRMEGVPARNLLPVGDNLGFRRPGFAVSLEPGVQYVHGGNILSITIARAIYRDRTRSVPDDLTGGHGDAAFANYVWLASYSFRVGRHSGHAQTASAALPHASDSLTRPVARTASQSAQ